MNMASSNAIVLEMEPMIPKRIKIQDDTVQNSETQLTTAFNKKPYTSGTISFFETGQYTKHKRHLKDVKFIKINADDGDNDSILQQVAEGVVNKVSQIRHKNLLLSVKSGALDLEELDAKGHKAIQDAIADVLKGTCVVTDGTNDGVSRLVGQAVNEFNFNQISGSHLCCPLIGIICLDRIRNKETIKEPWEVKKGVFGIDSDGELFIVDKKQRWTLNPASLTKVNVQRDGNTTTSPLTGDVHGNSSSPHFDVGALVQIRNKPATWNNIYGLYTEAPIGKIGFIVQVTQNNYLLIQVNGEQCSFWCKPDDVTLLTGEHFIDLLRTSFMKYELTKEDDKLVKAVMGNTAKDVYAIISQAYKDFMEFTSESKLYGVDCSGNFFVVDANGKRTTFGPDDLNKDGNDIASTDSDRDFHHGDLVMIRPTGSTDSWTDQRKMTIDKVGAIVFDNEHDYDIKVRVCGNIYMYNHYDLALVNRGRFDLLKEHFRNLKPEGVRDELQQAVNDDNFEKVTAVIRKAYTDSKHACEYVYNETNRNVYKNTWNKRHSLFVLFDKSTLTKFGREEKPFRAILEKQISSEMIGSRMKGDFNQDRQVLQYPLVNLLFNDRTTPKTLKFAMEKGIPSVVVITTDSDNCKRQDSAIADRTHQLKEEIIENLPFLTFGEHLLAVIKFRDMSKILVQMIVDVVWKASSVRTRLLEWILYDQNRKTDMVIPLISAAGKPIDTDYDELTPVLIAKDIAFIMHYCLVFNDADCVRALVQPDVNMNLPWIEASLYKELCDDNDGLLKRLKSKDPILWVMQRVMACPVLGKVEGYEAWKPATYSFDTQPGTKDVLPYWGYMFIWTLLLRKHDMAKILWTKTEHPLFMALIAHNVCKAVKKQTDDNVLIAEMEKELREWTTTAIEFLDECYQDGDKPTYDYLKMTMPFWNEKSCLDLAVDSRNNEFLVQQACRNLVEDVWNGQCTDGKLDQHQKPSSNTDLNKTQASEGNTSQKPSSDTDLNKFSVNQMQAPKWKFVYNAISQWMFMCLFAYVLLSELTPTVSVIEYVLLAWVLTISVEELRQMKQMPGHENVTPCVQLIRKLKNYFLSGWNMLDTLTIIMFFLGFGLRCKQYPEGIDYPRLVYAVDFAAFCIRFVYIFTAWKEFGPKILILKKMITDVWRFYMIMLMFVLAYAITSYSILYPGAPITWNNAKHLIRRPYWLLYGDLALDETEEFKDCTNDTSKWEDGTSLLCPTETGMTYGPFMMGVYLLFSNILLLNILIAMFNYTFTKIHEKSDKIWCFQRFVVIQDYAQRPVLCPPLNVLYVVWSIYKLCQWCVPKCTKDELSDDPFHVPYKDEINRSIKLSEFMKEAQRRYLNKKESDKNSMIETANEKLDHLKNEVSEGIKALNKKVDSLETKVSEGIEAPNIKVDGLETKAAKEEGYRNQALEGIEALNKKVDGLETKAKYEEESRKTMMDTTLKVAKSVDEFQGKILDQLRKMKDSIDNLNTKMADIEHKVDKQY